MVEKLPDAARIVDSELAKFMSRVAVPAALTLFGFIFWQHNNREEKTASELIELAKHSVANDVKLAQLGLEYVKLGDLFARQQMSIDAANQRMNNQDQKINDIFRKLHPIKLESTANER